MIFVVIALSLATLPTSLERNYQLLRLKNKGGLVVPAEGVIKVVIVAERYLRQLTDVNFASHQIKAVRLLTMVNAHVGAVDIFGLGHYIVETQFGVDNHHDNLISLLVSVFHKLRQHHFYVAKLHTQQLQRGNIRKKFVKQFYSWVISFSTDKSSLRFACSNWNWDY